MENKDVYIKNGVSPTKPQETVPVVEIRIEEYRKNINRTPALKLLMEGWLYVYNQGLIDNVMNVFWDDSAFVAFVNEESVGVLAYRNNDWMKQLDIGIVYVKTEHRRHGLWRQMWGCLVARAQEDKYLKIMSTTHINNEIIHNSLEQFNRSVLGSIITFDVPPLEKN